MNKIVLVEWEDATSYGETFHPEEIKELNCGTCRTIGFLLEKNKKYIKICAHEYKKVDGNYSYSTVWVIPKPWIIKIENL